MAKSKKAKSKKVENENVESEFVSTDEFLSDSGEEFDITNVSAVNDEFEMDSINNWTTTVGLIRSVIELIEKKIPTCSAHLFMHTPEYHEYRELDREGITAFSDDSVFIGCLSMENGIVPIEKMFKNYEINDPMICEVLNGLYKGKFIMPIVHGFDMVAYILFCEKGDNASKKGEANSEILTENDIWFLLRLSKRVQTNLYAAAIATRGQRNLLTMTKYPFVLQRHETAGDVNSCIFDDLKNQLSFEKGIAYRYDETTKTLYPFSFYKVDRDKVPTLKSGESISGQVFKSWKSVFVPDRASHPAYSIMKTEPFIKGSFVSVPLGTEQNKIGVITVSRSEKKSKKQEPFSVEHQYLLEIAAAFLSTEIMNRNLRDQIEESNMNVVKSLSSALEAKDLYTEGHSDRVALYSVGLAKKLGYSEDRIHMLRYGAQLHDIGKIGVSDAVINKTGGLDPAERKEIETHTDIGYRILSANPYFKNVRDFVRYHHEQLDGTGYHKKKLGEYPEEAMIISCADIYDALTSDRPYRKALSRKVAFQILSENIGKHFTKEIYDALKDYIENEAPTEA